MRQLVILHRTPGEHSIQTCSPAIHLPNQTAIPFSNAKTLLGQEFPYAIYDMRAENGVNFNLEAFAIVAGTIQRNGTLYLLCHNWETLEQEIDLDSLRWNDGKAIAAPNFWAFFKALVKKYRFEITPLFSKEQQGEIWQNLLTEKSLSHFDKDDCQSSPSPHSSKRGTVFTQEQVHILEQITSISEPIHLITAPRGRGKSTLAGKLAEKISQDQRVIITSRAKSALPSFWKQIENRQNIDFFAPDRLIQAVENQEIPAKSWLFIDEAASLPLPMLSAICHYFDHIVMTTTTQNYEGTGRGFELKLPQMLGKPFKHWTLQQPLRWEENDQLEEFVNDLLLLAPLPPKCLWHLSPLSPRGEGQIFALFKGEKEGEGIKPLMAFYNLLATAHYKTTPTDLRRLFDGENQSLHEIRENGALIGGIWAVKEGGLDEQLAQAVWRGERRPAGNLVAQYLCFQGNLIQAATLHSVRISRIAVTPEKQGQGYGKRLVSETILQISKQNAPLVDFVSVSFGLSKPLYRFWLQCGFVLVQITPNTEASSGLPSAMMLYPLSHAGKRFIEKVSMQFQRDLPLLANASILQKILPIPPLVEAETLCEGDWQNLSGFVYGQRSFSSCYVALKRLALHYPIPDLTQLFAQNRTPNKNQLQQLKTQIALLLENMGGKHGLENCR